jgi:hypothetical protein
MDASLACRYLGDLNSMFLISNIITRRLSKAADTSVEALEWTLEGGVGTPTDGNAQRAIPSWSWSPFPSWSPPPSEGAMVVYTPPLADPPKTYLRSLAENLAWGAGMLYSTTGSLAGVMQPMTAYGCNGLATAAGAMAVALQPMAAYGCNGLATAAGAMAEALRPAPVVVDPSMSTKDLVQVAVAAGVGTCVVLFAVAATARGVVAVRA